MPGTDKWNFITLPSSIGSDTFKKNLERIRCN